MSFLSGIIIAVLSNLGQYVLAQLPKLMSILWVKYQKHLEKEKEKARQKNQIEKDKVLLEKLKDAKTKQEKAEAVRDILNG